MSDSDSLPDRSGARVLRSWTGIAVVACIAAGAVFLLIEAAVRAGFSQMLLIAPWVLVVLWAIYAASAASMVRMTARGVELQNLLRRTSFGWRHVKDVDFRWQLEFTLDNGAKVTAMGGPAQSRPRRQSLREREVEGVKLPSGVRELAELQERWKTAGVDANAPIRRSWDWSALGVLLVLVVWAVIAIMITS